MKSQSYLSGILYLVSASSYQNTYSTDEGWFDNAMMKSVRNGFTRLVTGEDEVHEVGSLGTNKAW